MTDSPYDVVYDAAGNKLGYRARDREWWNAPRARVDRAPVDEETMSVEAILDALDPWNPGLPLRARLAVAHERDPVRVSRMTLAILDTPGLRDPCAVLYFRLGSLGFGET